MVREDLGEERKRPVRWGKGRLEETSLIVSVGRLGRTDISLRLPEPPAVHNFIWPYDGISSSIWQRTGMLCQNGQVPCPYSLALPPASVCTCLPKDCSVPSSLLCSSMVGELTCPECQPSTTEGEELVYKALQVPHTWVDTTLRHLFHSGSQSCPGALSPSCS